MLRRFALTREAALLAALVALCLLIATRFSGFIAPANLGRVFNDSAPLIILTLGQMIVIVTRCIDLSVAANLALCGMVAALLNVAFPGLPVIVIITAVVLLGGLLGAFNGILVWKVGIPPIVVTLGTLTIYRGIIFLISDGAWVNSHEMSAPFKALPRAVFLGMPVLSWCAILCVAGFVLMIARTPLGRSFFAVGGNPHAAVYTGINVGRTQFMAFTIAGALSGLTGYLWVSRYAVAYVDIAGGFELDVIAACVIGGISIAGGIGSVFGAVLGALFLGVIKNALPVVDISPFWQMAISGAAIIIAVILNSRSNRPKGRLILRTTGPKT
ncbi:ABC transporter permease [Loktanella salsilacus]|uniref:ABC transporter permease n=1 Tax=Loktanella salsilacus TaxID=195913 RepID=UPI003735795B